MSALATHTISSQDEFAEFDLYNESDCFAGIDFDVIPELGPPRALSGLGNAAEPTPQQAQAPLERSENRAVRTTISSQDSLEYAYDELDASVWTEVDAIVQDAMARDAAAPTRTQRHNHDEGARDGLRALPTFVSSASSMTNSQTSTRSLKRKASADDGSAPPSNKRGKGGCKRCRHDYHESARRALTDLEDSITCSICYQIFSEPQVASPCGHTLCGECIVGWIKQNIRKKPRCPICRTPLTQGTLIIPNFTLRDAIERHIAALANSGIVDWQPQGARYTEWTQRNARWLQLAPDVRNLQNKRWDDRADSELSQSQEMPLLMIVPDPASDSEPASDDEETNSEDLYWTPPPAQQPRRRF